MRQAFLIEAKNGQIGEYINRHSPIWPDLKEELKNYGISNYSIFNYNGTNLLFGYFEIENEELFKKIEQSEICQKWWLHMREVLICEDGINLKAKEEILTEIFHLD